MPSMDQFGNKIAQSRISKKNISYMMRGFRMQNRNKQFCEECGFHVRGLNHKSGSHHQKASER